MLLRSQFSQIKLLIALLPSFVSFCNCLMNLRFFKQKISSRRVVTLFFISVNIPLHRFFFSPDTYQLMFYTFFKFNASVSLFLFLFSTHSSICSQNYSPTSMSVVLNPSDLYISFTQEAFKTYQVLGSIPRTFT